MPGGRGVLPQLSDIWCTDTPSGMSIAGFMRCRPELGGSSLHARRFVTYYLPRQVVRIVVRGPDLCFVLLHTCAWLALLLYLTPFDVHVYRHRVNQR